MKRTDWDGTDVRYIPWFLVLLVDGEWVKVGGVSFLPSLYIFMIASPMFLYRFVFLQLERFNCLLDSPCNNE
jgi:hypothetical protein